MKTLISIIGPTGIGKTKLTIFLAKYFKTEIISCDSRQFYKELNIGTSKPSIKQLKIIKHHFISHISILNKYNIYKYENDVLLLMNKLFLKYNIIFLVGGSLLYEKTVIEGLNFIPKIKGEGKKKLNKYLKKKNIKYLLKKLKKLDIIYYKNLKNKNNKKKLIKDLIIIYLTKKNITYFYKKKKKPRPFNNFLRIILIEKREKIYKNINYKVDKMIKKGLIKEVKVIHKKYKKLNLKSLNTIGYKEVFKYLEGKKNIEESIYEIKKNTRNYAKKQISWLKNKIKSDNAIYINPKKKKKILNIIKKKIFL
ncbi:MAG: tRNA (adenosine(37)-N6)-dimethylallyltransferase MiaA [Candidatus Shikimatogenerans sp. JK-2022]|nr:tRNA (adenosine(37)-N6)-dimethylallyltransferase MiaA [Candidatus Shikimatogenerans bostrichidophilus]